MEWSLLQGMGIGVEAVKTTDGLGTLLASISSMKLGAISSYPLRAEMEGWIKNLKQAPSV